MTLRDADDPVLNDEMALRVAWYHTSTDPELASPRPPADAGGRPNSSARVIPDDVADGVRERHENQALHLGTYEAAIESMLRKMRDEDDGRRAVLPLPGRPAPRQHDDRARLPQ